MDHSSHNNIDNKKEYIKFAAVLLFILLFSIFHANIAGLSLMQFLESFMGIFFIVFASFKIYNLKEFATGFKSYEVMKNRSVVYGYIYPFVQFAFGLLYILGYGSRPLDLVVFVWSAYSSYIVYLTLRKKGDIHCVCLGNVIKLPLSTISFVEDFGMSIMALAMLILR